MNKLPADTATETSSNSQAARRFAIAGSLDRFYVGLWAALNKHVRRILRLLSRISPGVRPRFLKAYTRGWYQLVSLLGRRIDVTFMNYGYAPLTPGETVLELSPDDAVNRYSIELYHRVTGAIDLRGKDVLEVGCGRGGGASFVMKYHHPLSLTCMDLAGRAVAFCRNHYRAEGLSFVRGDAEKIPFPSESFDVVINVESSHCYPQMEDFLCEVVRVLRPEGYFLFADIRDQWSMDSLRGQLVQAGFSVLQEERLTPGVLRALELDSERKSNLIQSKVPSVLRSPIEHFAGIKGTPVYESFRTGEWEYIRFVLRKAR